MTITAVVDQDSFRGRNDDGSETTATWKALVNTDWSQNVDENFRARFMLQETAGGNPNNNFHLQYNLAAAGWNNVTGASSVVRSFASANVADAAATTEQMAGPGTFEAGQFDEVDGAVSTTFSASRETEHEWCLQIISGDVTNGQTLQLRVIYEAGGVLDTYTNTPTITVIEAEATVNPSKPTIVNQAVHRAFSY